ncbi:ABC transporter ATP-binding protein [Aquiflexum sp.]|uniref:ABC transporter ATP-binding protein n=1 Tax=Aquiflexum sp. TaxID=1872584 RepID=UPI0035936862
MPKDPNHNPKNILLGSSLSLGYRNGSKINRISEDLYFNLEKGKLTCLLGPNGVGKSTLVKTIMGQVPPLSGEIFLEGKPLTYYSQKALAKKIAVVLTEKITTGNLTVGQLVALGRIPHTGWLGRLSNEDQNKVEQAISQTHIGYIRNQPLSECSDGQLQKTMIARALAQDGEILILDEPTAHLDLVNRFEIMHLLRQITKESKKAVLVVTHDLDIAIETADVFWLMQCGQPLVTGLPEDLILNGQINLLLPSDRLSFNSKTGKVQPKVDEFAIHIEGPEAIVQWIQSALQKNILAEKLLEVHIRITENPLRIFWKEGEKEREFLEIGGLLEFLGFST